MEDNFSFGKLLDKAKESAGGCPSGEQGQSSYTLDIQQDFPEPGEYALTTAAEVELKKPQILNRAQRRAQEKKLRKMAKMIETKRPRKAKDLTPEEQLQVKRNLLARIKEENEKFRKIKEEEEKKANE